MKKLKYILPALLASSLLFSACKKELDQFPPGAIATDQSFKSVQDAKAYNGGLFAGLRGNTYGSSMFSADIQADQLNASLDYGNRNGNPHRWTTFLSDDGALSTSWNGPYSAMKNVNVAIAGYPSIPTTTVAQKAELDRYLGSAYLMRAYYYSMLIVKYAKAYNPATAATDLGVPLVLTYNVNAKLGRATIKAVYDQILSDIAAAKPLLAATAGVQGSKVFTTHSVSALEARVKLNMLDFPGAAAAAETVINSATYPLITSQATFTSMWTNDLSQEVITKSAVSIPNELPNTNVVYLGLIPATGRFTPDFIPSQWVVDMYDNADIRKAAYLQQKTLTIQGATVPNIWLVNKYPGNPALFTGAATNYAHAPIQFRVAEMYLISAEANARAGAATSAQSLIRLNNLRTARGLVALSGITGVTLENAVKDERFRELAFEGFRLWDLKRYGEGFTRRLPQNASILINTSGEVTLNIAASNDKFTWGIPAGEINTNAGLNGQQNPGW